ncbi:hypothetical protein [uncultured Tateyamaria sp.]|uniref:hypothetical protein n=1 Tax=Tateyamaria sp. 1078 TaxID=3417464 RepID=UPI00262163C9|nr:hypothetical protein [uncultured Tateyamaria sp.]
MPDFDAIEAQVARDRAALSQSLDALTDAADPERATTQISTIAHEYGGEIGRQTWEAARQNPAAFALVGAGIGLLLTGTGKRPERRPHPETAVPPAKAMQGFDARVAAADTAIKEEMTGMSDETVSASRLRAAMDHGLDKLPAAARARVLKARKSALQAQERVEAKAAKLAIRSRTFMDDQPLAVGALAVGLGALVGALLPSTQREDELLGAHRDAMMRSAQDILREELQNAHAAASEKLQDSTNRSASDTPLRA